MSASRADAEIFFQIGPGPGGTVNLTIEGSGLVSGTGDNFLLVGTTVDTFLPDEAPQRYTGTVPSAPTPIFSLGGIAAQNNFYRDDDSSFTGLESIIGFYFGTAL